MNSSAEDLYNIIDSLSEVDMGDKSALKKIRRNLSDFDDPFIVEEIGVPRLALMLYILNIKHKGRMGVMPLSGDDCCIYARTGIAGRKFCIANISYFPVEIHFIKEETDHINIEGNFVNSALFEDQTSYFAKINGQLKSLKTKDYKMDSYLGSQKYELKPGFCLSVPLNESAYEISFYMQIGGNICRCGKINSLRFAPIADILENQYCKIANYVGCIRSCAISFLRDDTGALSVECEEAFQKSLLSLGTDDALWAVQLRRKYFDALKEKKRPIWLFMDRVDRADDNGEVLYRYAKSHSSADCYFIIQKDAADYKRLKKTGGVLALNSDEHLLRFLLADYIFTSQANGLAENPFRDKAEYFRDLYHRPKTVFLQHGITKDDQSRTFNRFNTNFAGFVVSTKRERDSILNGDYFYDENQVWLTGMPRFDRLYNDDKKIILIAPSWRKKLMEQQWDEATQSMIWRFEDGYEDSEYVSSWRAVLKSKKLHELCEKYNYRLAFMPHALVEPYIRAFLPDSKDIICWDSKKPYREAFAQASLLITDYSSVAFDFAYLRKPVLYYQFDREDFYNSHTYSKGYFDYLADAFGEIAFSKKRLIKLAGEYVEKECRMKKRYRERADRFFEYNDAKCCERVLEKL